MPIDPSIGGSPPTSGTADLDREAAARQIADAAKQRRALSPRWLLVLSLVVAAICCIGLAIGWYESANVKPDHQRAAPTPTNGSFAAGLVVGVVTGAIATTAALARRR